MVTHGVKTMLKRINYHCSNSPSTRHSSRFVDSTKCTVSRAIIRTVVPALCVLALPPAAALAAPKQQPTLTPQVRTYVSGLGSDSNACTAAQPCRTLKAALALTTAGGEIYVLDSADYGPVTINKAVTITADGAVAGVLATSGVGISISAGANDVVTLRGLNVDGGKTGGV